MNKLINAKLDNFKKDNDSRFISGRLMVCHDGLNFNGSEFETEDILRCAEETLRESPVLGSVVVDEETGEKRLNGHDMDYILEKTSEGYNMRINHIERIYGFIPHDANIGIENINDKNYLISECVLWKNYLDDLLDILEKQEGCPVSMEIECLDSYMNSNGNVQIKNFKFLGITMLGVEPGMENANLSITNFSMEDMKNELKSMMNAYSLEKGGENMENENQVVEETQEVEFEEEVVEIKTDEVEEVSQDVEFTEEQVEDEFTCDGEKKKYSDEEYETLSTDFESLKVAYAELEAKLEGYSDYEDLKLFKESYDNAKYEAEVNEITEMFSLDEEDYKELRENVMSREITQEQYKEKLGFKFAMKQLNAKKFSKEEKVSSEIAISSEIEVNNAPYGGVFEKYLKNKNK